MKLSIVTNELEEKSTNWELQQIIKEVSARKIPYELINITNHFEYKNEDAQLGSHIFWWKSDLIRPVQLGTFLELMENKTIINGLKPGKILSRYKSYQQTMVNRLSDVRAVPTFLIRNVDEADDLIAEGLLSYPFIQKPNFGFQGRGVRLIKSKEDLLASDSALYKTVLQPYIENTGDYRILIVGGEVLGVMRRTAAEGQIVNNFSQGGEVEHITDTELVDRLGVKSLKIAKVFQSNFCGIDLIYDEKVNQYRFLEINFSPGWKGFGKATGINVAKKIVDEYLTNA